MGQTFTNHLPESIIGETVDAINYEIRKQTQSLREINSLTFEEFHQCLSSLNDLSKKCLDTNGHITVFAIKRGSDQSPLWKALVRIACVKCNPNNNTIFSYKLVNLRQFLKIFNTFQTHLEVMSSCEEQHDRARQLPTLLTNMTDISPADEQAECCCICLDRQVDIILPCDHVFCSQCIERWNESHNKCPLCQSNLDTIDESWVLPDLPKTDEVNEKILTELNALAYSSSSENEQHEDDGDGDD